MANAQETREGIEQVNQKLQKIGNESALTLQRVTDLEQIIANNPGGQIPQEVTDALEALKQQAQLVDDLVPDAEPGVLEQDAQTRSQRA